MKRATTRITGNTKSERPIVRRLNYTPDIFAVDEIFERLHSLYRTLFEIEISDCLRQLRHDLQCMHFVITVFRIAPLQVEHLSTFC